MTTRSRRPAHHGPRALLICNGEPPTRALARQVARETDIIVAADGGANASRTLGLVPEVIVGDMDSITAATRRVFSRAEYVHVTRQDNTDLEKALDLLCSRGIEDVFILGAMGRRIDFTLGNVAVLWKYTGRLRVTILGDHWRAFPAGSVTTIKSKPGTTLSLIPFGRVTGITLGGLKYPLRNATLSIGDAAVSNVISGSSCMVRKRKGNLLVVVQDDSVQGAHS